MKKIILISVAIIFAILPGCQNQKEELSRIEVLNILAEYSETMKLINKNNATYSDLLGHKLRFEEVEHDTALMDTLSKLTFIQFAMTEEIMNEMDERKDSCGNFITDELTLELANLAISSINSCLVHILAMNALVSEEGEVKSDILTKPVRTIKEGESYEEYFLYLHKFSEESSKDFVKKW